MKVARVIVDVSTSAVDRVFDYLTGDIDIRIGDRVSVPFANKVIEGFVVDIADIEDSPYKLKCIAARLDDEPLIVPEMLELMRYMREAFYLRYVDCLRLFLPSGLRNGAAKKLVREYVQLRDDIAPEEILDRIGARAKNQSAIVNALTGTEGAYLNDLSAKFGASAVKALADKGYLIKSRAAKRRKPFTEVMFAGERTELTLTEDQRHAIEAVKNGGPRVNLLHGVTGSGKTEVYLRLIDNALGEGKTAIMLVPEISLTPQMLRIFRSRYGDGVALLHSGLSVGERYDEWMRIYSGEAVVVLGARSAIFSPLQNIGVIIVDEEHDQSYISDNNPRFSALEVAIRRGKYNGAQVVFGSATPSIDSYYKAEKGEYRLIRMSRRISDNGLPEISVVDMSKELMSGNAGIFSRELKENLTEAVKAGNQAIIFLNRRGYASFQMCSQCGYVAKCTDCDIALTYHIDDGLLKCHYCGKRYKPLTHCPSCGSEHIRYGKAGTEQVIKELKSLLPGVNTLRLDNDTTRSKTAYHEILGAFREKKAQVLVGTQMVAKGHDFPNVTLVGVLDADMSLYYSSYLSNERTFQLLTQVAGRAGRADKAGRVIVQTYSPRHFLFEMIQHNNYRAFYDKEINTREVSKFPPFTAIVRILVRHADEMKAVEQTKAIFEGIKELKRANEAKFVYCQAMKAPVGKIEKLYRYQIIMRITAEAAEEMLHSVHGIVAERRNDAVSVFIELNPQDMR